MKYYNFVRYRISFKTDEIKYKHSIWHMHTSDRQNTERSKQASNWQLVGREDQEDKFRSGRMTKDNADVSRMNKDMRGRDTDDDLWNDQRTRRQEIEQVGELCKLMNDDDDNVVAAAVDDDYIKE